MRSDCAEKGLSRAPYGRELDREDEDEEKGLLAGRLGAHPSLDALLQAGVGSWH